MIVLFPTYNTLILVCLYQVRSMSLPNSGRSILLVRNGFMTLWILATAWKRVIFQLVRRNCRKVVAMDLPLLRLLLYKVSLCVFYSFWNIPDYVLPVQLISVGEIDHNQNCCWIWKCVMNLQWLGDLLLCFNILFKILFRINFYVFTHYDPGTSYGYTIQRKCLCLYCIYFVFIFGSIPAAKLLAKYTIRTVNQVWMIKDLNKTSNKCFVA